MQPSGLKYASFIPASTIGLYGMILSISLPPLAMRIYLGRASLILIANSCAANPPKTTECTAPILAQASIPMTASGTIGI